MNKTWKWILIGIVGLVILAFAAKLLSNKNGEGLKVTAEIVKRTTIIESVSASGKIYPELEVKVGTGLSGEVTDLYVKEGDSVTKGQVLARILTESTRNAVPRITGNDYSSLLQSFQNPSPSRATNISVKAPISGTISMLGIKKGERVGGMQLQGSELLRIADMKTMEVRVDVNENDIIKVSVGDSADVEVEAYNKRKFKGIVTYIANSIQKREASSFLQNDITSYEVHIQMDAGSYQDLIKNSKPGKFPFRSGMNARAEIKTMRKENIMSVPVGAVASRAKGSELNIDEKKKEKKKESDELASDPSINTDELEEVVFVITNENKVERRVVITGIQDLNHIEIVSGLKDGEKVVTGPYNSVSRTLRSGQQVRVVSKDELFEK